MCRWCGSLQGWWHNPTVPYVWGAYSPRRSGRSGSINPRAAETLPKHHHHPSQYTHGKYRVHLRKLYVRTTSELQDLGKLVNIGNRVRRGRISPPSMQIQFKRPDSAGCLTEDLMQLSGGWDWGLHGGRFTSPSPSNFLRTSLSLSKVRTLQRQAPTPLQGCTSSTNNPYGI